MTEPHTSHQTIAACVNCTSGSESATQDVTTHLGPVALEHIPLEEHWGQVLVQPGS